MIIHLWSSYAMPKAEQRPKHATRSDHVPQTTDKYKTDGREGDKKRKAEERAEVVARKDVDLEGNKGGRRREEKGKLECATVAETSKDADDDVVETRGHSQKITRGQRKANREEEVTMQFDGEEAQGNDATNRVDPSSKKTRSDTKRDKDHEVVELELIEDPTDADNPAAAKKAAQTTRRPQQEEANDHEPNRRKSADGRDSKHRAVEEALQPEGRTRGQSRKNAEPPREKEIKEHRGEDPIQVSSPDPAPADRPARSGVSSSGTRAGQHQQGAASSAEATSSSAPADADDGSEQVHMETETTIIGSQSPPPERAPCPPVTPSPNHSDAAQLKEEREDAEGVHRSPSTTEGDASSCPTNSDKTARAEGSAGQEKEAEDTRPQKRLRSGSKETCFYKFKDPREVVLVYPLAKSTAKKQEGLITVTAKDFETLREEELLNDTIIEFYIKFIEQRMDAQTRERCYFFSTFFWKKLLQGRTPEERHRNVATWTRKLDIFEKDFLFIPICHEVHWTLAIICAPGGVVNLDKDAASGECRDDRGRQHTILYLDSMGGYMKDAVVKLTDYLKFEWKVKKEEEKKAGKGGEGGGVHLSSSHGMRKCICSARCLFLPQQNNSCDCGLFLLRYIELFCEKYVTNQMSYEDIQDEQTLKWFERNEISNMRAEIQNCIMQLRDEWKRENGEIVDRNG
ncbi:hypothetical protein GUITHDRAFT_100795 [Guillardia theta CCMP2712]|uniref:Ubiquitin-like protease family profile domain-containing protein n=2 Tax=Guillardia theta TaxID=55529 RepID=L1K0E4_GUITC|nr:hypothetical protein GUITHDRAFT_100795 [Guillardia theta CCMP2712]EKX53828.1 hypothetical protein GUITHDRAFT_100795 [Guillardia theta CCMP2712]|eukprot:XP_005840808.1 hypothetical protein GUITHDRAFT_100795 [Guillardia theta CCMP2712]